MKIFVILYLAVASSQATSIIDVFKAEWDVFKVTYEKSYSDLAEERRRLEIFKNNKFKIAEHNKRWAQNEVSYELGINQFADMLPEEFEQIMLTSLNITEIETTIFGNEDYITHIPAGNVELPTGIDWRHLGAVTGVKSQGICNSCWAFSTTGTLEGQHFRATRKLISLSEQNLVDCATERYGNNGCNGGNPYRALAYVKDNGGIDTERSYPYRTKQGACRFNRNSVGAKVRGVVHVPQRESTLTDAVATKGPISVAINASKFQHYKNGVFNDPKCNADVTHALLVVGYGHDRRGGDYWLVKNSWSTHWGEGGYIRMARNRNNQCGIANYAVYPQV